MNPTTDTTAAEQPAAEQPAQQQQQPAATMNRDDFAKRLKVQPVEVPEEGKTAFVRVMNGGERKAWLKVVFASEEDGEANAVALLARTVCDADGVRIFTDSDDDAQLIRNMDGRVSERLNVAALKLNGFIDTKSDHDDAKKD